MARKRLGPLLATVAFLAGCATYRPLEPTLQAQPRDGLEVSPPLLVAVIDGRTQLEGPVTAASDLLLEELKRIYGAGIEEHPFFGEVHAGRVALRLRIRELGSNFGSRIVGAAALADVDADSEGIAADSWGSVIARVRERRSVLASGLQTEGWWIGTAWLDAQLVDSGPMPVAIAFPIVAEARHSNTFGYGSATDATQEAWRSASADLLLLIDSVLLELRSRR